MRIRKNAKLSAALLNTTQNTTTSSSLTTTNNESSSLSSSSCCLIPNNNICQLNQSPWDIITPSFQLDDYIVNYNVNIAQNRRWFDFISDFQSGDSLNTLGFGENDNNNDRDDGLGENANNLSCIKNDCETDEEEIKLEGDGLEEMKLCGETDEQGWQCGSVVQNGYTMCEYHLSGLQTYEVWNAKKKFGGSRPMPGCRSRRAKKRPNTNNPHDYYYYSGFGPSWGKKRGIMGTDLDGIDDGDVDVEEQKGKRFEPEMRPVGLDYIDDDDDEYSNDDDEIGILRRKRERKPVKERSLKSLM
uniref:uncharacterized protein LOC122598196 n=1 Tax=Erigeron canadensis TaxID=72917 RepID=UPI001CB9AAF7|nr:uncharacterized protein LOC122598196 [Erigeron canadensis]